jgi:hypothetical protein
VAESGGTPWSDTCGVGISVLRNRVNKVCVILVKTRGWAGASYFEIIVRGSAHQPQEVIGWYYNSFHLPPPTRLFLHLFFEHGCVKMSSSIDSEFQFPVGTKLNQPSASVMVHL